MGNWSRPAAGPRRSGPESVRARLKARHLSAWVLTACGLWLVLLGLYFMFLRPPLLPEDTRFMGSSLAQVRAAVPGLEGWLLRVFVVMGGFIAGTGVLTMFAARVAAPSRWMGKSGALAISGAMTVALMSVMNFDLQSDFRWLLLVPALAWLAGFVLHLAGR